MPRQGVCLLFLLMTVTAGAAVTINDEQTGENTRAETLSSSLRSHSSQDADVNRGHGSAELCWQPLRPRLLCFGCHTPINLHLCPLTLVFPDGFSFCH